jgi:thiamine-monophosphate kinase
MRKMNKVHENRLLSRWANLFPRHPDQIGAFQETDAELLPLDENRVLAITVDTVAEEISAGLYKDARTAGRTAALSSLSDLAAVGAEPLGLLFSTTIPQDNFATIQSRLGAGINEALRAADVAVLGGDTNEGTALEVTCVAAGLVPRQKVISRVGAQPGDLVFVSGPIGLGGALAAALLLDIDSFPESDYRPQPRLREGQIIRRHASCCMDTSDGLIATIDQLSRLNSVRFQLETRFDALLHPAVQRLRSQADLPSFVFAASYHGEFELVFTLPPGAEREFLAEASSINWQPLKLGRVDVGEGIATSAGQIDGAWVRNLLHESDGDLMEYARRLIAGCPRE